MSKRILIIDDEANIRRVIRLTLEAAGWAQTYMKKAGLLEAPSSF